MESDSISTFKLTLLLVPGFSGIVGDEGADRVARDSARLPFPPRFSASLQDAFDLTKKKLNSVAEQRYLYLRYPGRGKRYIHKIRFGDERPWFCGMHLPRNRINLITQLRSGQTCTAEQFVRMGWNIPTEWPCGGVRSLQHLLNDCHILWPGRPSFFGFLNSLERGLSVPLNDLDDYIFKPSKELMRKVYLFFNTVNKSYFKIKSNTLSTLCEQALPLNLPQLLDLGEI